MGELGKLTPELLGTQAARIKTFQKQINTQCDTSSPIQGWTWGWGSGGMGGWGEVGGLCSARPARPLGCAPLHVLFPGTSGRLSRPGLRQRPAAFPVWQGAGWIRRNEQRRERDWLL